MKNTRAIGLTALMASLVVVAIASVAFTIWIGSGSGSASAQERAKPALPIEQDFVFDEVRLQPAQEESSPRISEDQAVQIAANDVLGPERASTFLSGDFAYNAELRSFSFNLDAGNYPDVRDRTVWTLRIEGVPIALPCGPPPPEGFSLQCPQNTDIIAIIDAATGEHLHGNLQTKGERKLTPID